MLKLTVLMGFFQPKGLRWPSGRRGAVEVGRGGRVEGGAVAEWVRALAWAGDRTVSGQVRTPLW